MTNTSEQPMSKSVSSTEVEYLLKELEIQVAIESKARDRVEQMVNYFLTTIAAIIGAVLLVTELKSNPLLVIFLAAFLIFIFAVSLFYRFCRLRRIITHTKLNRRLIRNQLIKSGLNQASFLINIEGEPTGFSNRMVRNLKGLVVLCSLLGAVVVVFGILLLSTIFEQFTSLPTNQVVLLIVSASIGFIITSVPLFLILNNYNKYANDLIIEKLNPKEINNEKN